MPSCLKTTRTSLTELTALSQTPESDEEGILPPLSPILLPSYLGTQGRLVLLLNWYPHFLEQRYTLANFWEAARCEG